jgi:hypothetical protein
MSGPTAADYAASRRGGIKVAALAAAGLIAAVAAYLGHHHAAGVVIATITLAGVWLEGLPKAARARRRYRG